MFGHGTNWNFTEFEPEFSRKVEDKYYYRGNYGLLNIIESYLGIYLRLLKNLSMRIN